VASSEEAVREQFFKIPLESIPKNSEFFLDNSCIPPIVCGKHQNFNLYCVKATSKPNACGFYEASVSTMGCLKITLKMISSREEKLGLVQRPNILINWVFAIQY
jgi:hypothetical protein